MINSHWLTDYDPSNEEFWNKKGKKIAWKTLTITTIALTMSFATWFLFSVVVIKLPKIGFQFSDNCMSSKESVLFLRECFLFQI